jgi:hypothetical protein
MTKAQALKDFREAFAESLAAMKGDVIAKNELFWAYADLRCKDGAITQRQYETWSNPF